MKKMIRVTQLDIDSGSRASPTACPIAKAVARTFPQYNQSVSVDPVMATLWGNSTQSIPSMWAMLPPKAKRFVTVFDRKGRRAVKPFNFYLEMKP